MIEAAPTDWCKLLVGFSDQHLLSWLIEVDVNIKAPFLQEVKVRYLFVLAADTLSFWELDFVITLW